MIETHTGAQSGERRCQGGERNYLKHSCVVLPYSDYSGSELYHRLCEPLPPKAYLSRSV